MATQPNFNLPPDPNTYAQQLQLQRQQAIADALLQESQTPLTAGMPATRVVPRLGIAGGLVKLAQALGAGYLQKQTLDKRSDLMQQQMQNLQGMFGGGQPSYSGAQSAMAQTPAQGQLGPTNAAAASVPAQPASAQSGPMLIPGLDPQVAMRWYMSDPGAYMKALGDALGPTPEQKNWRAQGVDPRTMAEGTIRAGQRAGMTDPERLAAAIQGAAPGAQQDALIAAQTRANYITPIDAKPGTPVLDPVTLQPRFFAPKTADGIGLNFSDPLHPQAYALPGYAQANAGIEGAATAARTDNSVSTNVPGPGGAPMSGKNRDLFGGSSQVAPADQNAQDREGIRLMRDELPKLSPADQEATKRAIARMEDGIRARGGVVTGQSTTDAKINAESADPIAKAPEQVQLSKSAITGLEAALSSLGSVPHTGPGTVGANEIRAVLNNWHVPLGKSDTENYQILQKYLQNSLNAAANGSSAGGSDARFESFMHGQPNAENMNKVPLESAIRYVLSQHDAAAARGAFLPQAYQAAVARGDKNPALTAQQQWAQVYNPEYFRIGRLTEDEQKRALNAMTPAQVKHFGQWRQAMQGIQ